MIQILKLERSASRPGSQPVRLEQALESNLIAQFRLRLLRAGTARAPFRLHLRNSFAPIPASERGYLSRSKYRPRSARLKFRLAPDLLNLLRLRQPRSD